MLHPILQERLSALLLRHHEIADKLSLPEIINDLKLYRTLSKEYADLSELVNNFKTYQELNKLIDDTKDLLNEEDEEVKLLAEEELKNLQEEQAKIADNLQKLLLPKDINDDCNIFLEIRAGTGGDEAAIFVGDLFRMYSRYAENMRWSLEIINSALGEHGGYKEIIARISGSGVYSHLKFESGAHRVQRVPLTESQGRIHTSACTVAILVESDSVDEIEINPADLRVDTYRASGAGGQHVNKTDSAIRITHLPSGIVIECQDERSQHKNRSRAMSLLKAKLLSMEQEKLQKQQAETRRSLIGSGDRSERIRTYNYPQGRITDHRINFTIYQLPDMLEGNIEPLITALTNAYQTEQLAELLK